MSVSLKRAYEQPAAADGYRVLVDGIWPRGVSKEDARLDEWRKEVAPSKALRQGLHGGGLRWGAFRSSYLAQLKQHRSTLRELARRAEKGRVTLVFAARDEQHNNAVVVRQYLRMLGAG